MSHGETRTIGIDIGGANLKLSDGRRHHRHVPFALWRQPESLANQLVALLRECPNHDRVAITMTGELTDCFANKKAGVAFIVDQMCGATDVPATWNSPSMS